MSNAKTLERRLREFAFPGASIRVDMYQRWDDDKWSWRVTIQRPANFEFRADAEDDFEAFFNIPAEQPADKPEKEQP